MKRSFRIFELAKNEQRVVLILIFLLVALAFVGYERRIHSIHHRPSALPESKASPSPTEIERMP